LVNVETRVLIAKLAGLFHQYHIFDVAFKDDGNEILSSDQSQKICAWSLDSKDIKKAIETSENMTLPNQKNKEPLITIEEPSKMTSQVHEHEVDSISYLFDDYIVSKSSANEVICWKFAEKVPLINGKINIAVETPVKVMKNIRYADISIKKHRIFYRFGIDKKNLIFVITSMNYGEFYSYEFGDSQLDLKIQKFPELLTTVRMFNFSPDGKYLIAGTASREIFLFSSNYFSYINN
jgi:WD40 repeat protein